MALQTFTFSVLADAAHVIEAIGRAIQQTFTFTASARDGVSISPEGTFEVPSGTSAEFTVTAQPGFEIADVLVDGVSVLPPQ